MDEIFIALTSGNSVAEWFLTKLLAALLGGLCIFLIQQELAQRNSEIPTRFFWRGFWFTFVSAVGGILLLRPENAYAAFSAGLLGWYSVFNLMKENNVGPTGVEVTDKAMSKDEIMRLFSEHNK